MLDRHQIRNGKLLQVAYNYYGYKQNLAGRYAMNLNSTADIDCIFLPRGEITGSLGSTGNGPRFAERGRARVQQAEPSAARWNAAGVVDFISN